MSAGQRPLHWVATLPDGRQASLLLRANAVNLLLDGEQPSFTFDLRGRLHGAFHEGRNYRRSLDNRVLAKWTATSRGQKQRQRRWLASQEAQALLQRVHDLTTQLASTVAGAPWAVQEAAASLARWDWAALEGDRARFQQIYSPVGILPPDQYLALVLQATHGCSHNACTFCTFYRDVPFRIKTPDQFRQHLADVVDFFGPAIAMRRSIFLADANALVAPMPRLLALLDVQRSVFSAQSSPLPLFAFIDAFHAERKRVADWQELRARGLARVYIGMESGHDPLLRWLNKPGDAAAVLDAVTTLKAADLQASVILLLGVGGDRYADGHVRDSIALLNAMPLTRGDLIYFSDFVAQADAPYTRLAEAAGIAALPPTALRAQEEALRAGFVARDRQHPPQFARYDIGEFVY
ncbi:MAG: radical SAM protein [Anaerolineae bacterium]